MDRTRLLLDRLTAWSPVLLLGGLAALTYWLDAQVQAPVNARGDAPRHEPDMYIERFRAVSLGPDGKARQSLSATRAEHFADDQTSEFAEPRLYLTEPGRPALTLTAERGKLSADRDNAWFTGNVRAERDAPAGGADDGMPGGKMTLTTQSLHIDTRRERFDTDAPVTIEEPRGIIKGTGLEFDNVAKTARLKSQIHGTMQPRPAPAKTP
ncbi:MAG TPA: LPS export ABC transporter periplasmic protein LptC [Kofleriaceae bacterium]|nr:LPS export ABC transporter periplasmic protein LptC [Kofleriaceae bacterium]